MGWRKFTEAGHAVVEVDGRLDVDGSLAFSDFLTAGSPYTPGPLDRITR